MESCVCLRRKRGMLKLQVEVEGKGGRKEGSMRSLRKILNIEQRVGRGGDG